MIHMDLESKAVVITGENICIDGGMTKQVIYRIRRKRASDH